MAVGRISSMEERKGTEILGLGIWTHRGCGEEYQVGKRERGLKV